MTWQKNTGYGKRSQIETGSGRLTSRHDDRFSVPSFRSQTKEMVRRISMLNREINLAKPLSARIA